MNLDVPDAIDQWENDTGSAAWKHPDAVRRRKFIETFHDFTRDDNAHRYGLIHFSTWIAQQVVGKTRKKKSIKSFLEKKKTSVDRTHTFL